MAKMVSTDLFKRMNRSVGSRLAQVRHRRDWRRSRSGVMGSPTVDTPIQEAGIFEDEIRTLEKVYLGMSKRLENARIYIPEENEIIGDPFNSKV